MKLIAVLLLVSVHMFGCAYSQKLEQSAFLQETKRSDFRYSVTIRGVGLATNPLHPTGKRAFVYVLYLNEKEGMCRAEDVIYERNEAGLSVVQTGKGDRMRGTVEIHQNALNVQLELAIFDKNDRVTGYVPSPLNGVFILKRQQP